MWQNWVQFRAQVMSLQFIMYLLFSLLWLCMKSREASEICAFFPSAILFSPLFNRFEGSSWPSLFLSCLTVWWSWINSHQCFDSKIWLLPELWRVLSCKLPAVFLHFPLKEKGPWGPFYQLQRVWAKWRHLLKILLKALMISTNEYESLSFVLFFWAIRDFRCDCRLSFLWNKFTILYQGPKIWNSLPISITSPSSFFTFKTKMLQFYL